MADNTLIEWTDMTWNPITGCSVVSPGCTNCYAMRLAGTRLKHHPSRAGLTRDTKAGPVWNGEVRLNEEWLDEPLRKRAPRMIFVCAHGDLFAEGVPDEWIDRVFAVMALAPQHTFQVLTKRAERMRDYLRDSSFGMRVGGELMKHARGNAGAEAYVIDLTHRLTVQKEPLPNVWLGVSAEDQRRAGERVPLLLSTPAAVRWVSAEPLLGPIDFEPYLAETILSEFAWYSGTDRLPTGRRRPGLDWIVAGGESGPGARPMHPDWARAIRDQCAAAGVAFHFKQWGEWASAKGLPGHLPIGHVFDDGYQMIRLGKKAAGRVLDGVTHDAFPEARP